MNRFQKIKMASILGIIGNLFLFIIKCLAGIFTHSQAMLADSFNSLGDILSSIMTFVGNKIASKQADDDHNLGHGKAEYIYSMLISIVMFLLVFELFQSGIKSLFSKGDYTFSIWLVIVCVITIGIKLTLFLYTRRVGKKYKSLLIDACSKDHRNDCVVTTFTLLATLMSLNGISYVDTIVGLGIAIWIFITAFDIFRQSYDVLMDKSISEETKTKVISLIHSHKEILKINHFNSTPVGYQYQISFTIFVDGKMSTFESHEIANHLEKEIAEKIPEIYLTVIHVNPMEVEKCFKKK